MFQTARSILKRDPAAHSLLQVILTYPGIRALFWYRIAHQLVRWHQYVLATLLSQHAAKITGITIAPEATIGKRVFIDHGVGTVIGATAIIEDDVTILHGVTLGTRRMTDQAGVILTSGRELSLAPMPRYSDQSKLGNTAKLALVPLC